MAQYFGSAVERWLDQIDSIRLMGFHATTSDLQNPYGTPFTPRTSGMNAIEDVVGEYMRQEAAPA